MTVSFGSVESHSLRNQKDMWKDLLVMIGEVADATADGEVAEETTAGAIDVAVAIEGARVCRGRTPFRCY